MELHQELMGNIKDVSSTGRGGFVHVDRGVVQLCQGGEVCLGGAGVMWPDGGGRRQGRGDNEEEKEDKEGGICRHAQTKLGLTTVWARGDSASQAPQPSCSSLRLSSVCRDGRPERAERTLEVHSDGA